MTRLRYLVLIAICVAIPTAWSFGQRMLGGSAPLVTYDGSGNISFPALITGANIRRGSGSPEGAVTGSVSDVYQETDAASGFVFWVKTAGTGTTDGWSPVVTQGDLSVSQQFVVFDFGTTVTTGDGKYFFVVPAELNGYNLSSVHARVITAGTTGAMNVDLARDRGGSVTDMLSTNLTVDSTEVGSDTAAAAAVIDTANDDLATYDVIRVDVDAVSTTPQTGLIITLGAAPP